MSNLLANEKVTLKFSWSEIEPLYNRALAKLASKVKMDGFRAGKVPAAIAKKHLSFEAIVNQTLQTVLMPKFLEEVKKNKMEPIGQPKLVIHKAAEGDDWEVEAQYATEPQVKLGDYEKTIAKHKKEAAKKIAEQKKEIIKQHEELKKKDAKHEVPDLEAKTDEEKKREADQITDMAVAELVHEMEIPLHEVLVQSQAEHQLQHLMEDLAQYKIEVDDYLKNIGQTREEFVASVEHQAEDQIKLHFLMEAIKKDKKMDKQEDLVDFLRKI